MYATCAPPVRKPSLEPLLCALPEPLPEPEPLPDEFDPLELDVDELMTWQLHRKLHRITATIRPSPSPAPQRDQPQIPARGIRIA